jgi:hypothetical protein
MAERIPEALIPQAALAVCPTCGPCVLVRVWMPLAAWPHMTAPLAPTIGDWHWCGGTPGTPAPLPPGDVPGVPEATALPTVEDDPLCRSTLLRQLITEAVDASGRPVDLYWAQTCKRCRVQTPDAIALPWLEGLLRECEAVLTKQASPPPAAPPKKRPRMAQAAPTPPDPTPGVVVATRTAGRPRHAVLAPGAGGAGRRGAGVVHAGHGRQPARTRGDGGQPGPDPGGRARHDAGRGARAV